MKKTQLAPIKSFLIIAFAVFGGLTTQGQTTAFTFQGRFTDSTVVQPTNGIYSMQFALYDAESDGNQIGSTIFDANVQVTNGIFTVPLDFGTNGFDGSPRFLEITVSNIVLHPRQAVTSAPYAIKSLNAVNANKLGGIDAEQYVLTNDSRLSDSREPNSGSSFYVQNRATQQADANFNISGNGTAGGTLSGQTVNSTTQFNINSSRVLGTSGVDNLYVGFGAGASNSGFGNTFAGRSAGAANNSGNLNTFFGNFAGGNNLTGSNNTFIGRNAGVANTAGSNNTIIGSLANVVGNNLTNATAIGAGATVATSNTIALGRADGSDTVIVQGLTLLSETRVFGDFKVTLAPSGSTPICGTQIFAITTLASCSSSIRYKNNVETFIGGLDLVKRLRPVTYNWKNSGARDIGFIAEEIAEIEPLLTTYNEKGQVEGVKYGQITTILVNAVKEQQAQIESQNVQIEMLKQIVCQDHSQAEVCK